MGLNASFTMRDEPGVPHSKSSQGEKYSYADEDRECDVVFPHEVLLCCVGVSSILQCRKDVCSFAAKVTLRKQSEHKHKYRLDAVFLKQFFFFVIGLGSARLLL